MNRVLLASALAAMLMLGLAAAPLANAEMQSSRVILVLVPNLRWEDISATSTPELFRLANDGAVGDINSRSRTRVEGVTESPLEGALAISAGSWAAPAPLAPAAYVVTERYEGGTAAEGYRRIMGRGSGYSKIAFLGLPMTQRFNDELSVGVQLGTLGQAIVQAGGSTAAVGNSDAGVAGGIEAQKIRPAAVAAMDGLGLVRFGDVSTNMLKADRNAPYGRTTDVAAVRERLREIDARLKAGVPNLTVVDPGDTYRAARIAPVVAEGVAEQHRRRAFGVVDRVVGVAEESLPADGVLIVASQVPGVGESGVEGFGPVIVYGDAWAGYLTSSSTHRTGVVTNLDVTATILDVLGIDRPVQVEGNPMTSVASSASESRVAFLTRINDAAVAIESSKPGVGNVLIIFTVVLFLLSTFVILRSRLWSPAHARRWSAVLRALLLAVLAVPPATWLMFAIVRWPQSKATANLVLIALAATLWGIGMLLVRTGLLRIPVVFLSLMMALVAMADQWFGAPLSFASLLGYSPLSGARYYGIGNEAAAALFAASVVGLACLMDEWPDSAFAAAMRRWGVPVIAAIVVGTAAAPFLGANVGVVAWGIVGFGLFWALVNGYRPTWRLALVGLLLIVVIVVAFSALDLFGGGEQTHLGRALVSAQRGGAVQLWDIVYRKAQTNLRVFTHTNWVYLLVVILAFLAFMRWRPQGDFARMLRANPYFASAITATLCAGVAAFFTEDTGITIIAIMLIWVGVGILYVMLADLPSRGAVDEPRVTEASSA